LKKRTKKLLPNWDVLLRLTGLKTKTLPFASIFHRTHKAYSVPLFDLTRLFLRSDLPPECRRAEILSGMAGTATAQRRATARP
jgi:hypothetical protein